MEYEIGTKKVFVFVSLNCDSNGYKKTTGEGGSWEAIIIEENGDTQLVYHESFKSREDSLTACKKAFENRYRDQRWKSI